MGRATAIDAELRELEFGRETQPFFPLLVVPLWIMVCKQIFVSIQILGFPRGGDEMGAEKSVPLLCRRCARSHLWSAVLSAVCSRTCNFNSVSSFLARVL